MALVVNSAIVLNDGAVITENAGAASQTIALDADQKTVIVIDNTSDATNALTATFAAGDGLNAGIGDVVEVIAVSKSAVFQFDSSRIGTDGVVTLTLATSGTVGNSKVVVITV